MVSFLQPHQRPDKRNEGNRAMPPAVSRAEQYRKIAEECLRWANQARSQAERQDFLAMARTSLTAAAEYDPLCETQRRRA